jgi:hypothetical protein
LWARYAQKSATGPSKTEHQARAFKAVSSVGNPIAIDNAADEIMAPDLRHLLVWQTIMIGHGGDELQMCERSVTQTQSAIGVSFENGSGDALKPIQVEGSADFGEPASRR